MKHFFCKWGLTTLVLTGMLAAGAQNGYAAEVTPLPEEPVYEIDQMDQMKQYYTGWVQWNSLTEDGRSCKIYAPEGARRDCKVIYIAVPSGVDAVEFLTEEGWTAVADESNELLAVMEPAGDSWGDEDSELAYMAAVYGKALRSSPSNV